MGDKLREAIAAALVEALREKDNGGRQAAVVYTKLQEAWLWWEHEPFDGTEV